MSARESSSGGNLATDTLIPCARRYPCIAADHGRIVEPSQRRAGKSAQHQALRPYRRRDHARRSGADYDLSDGLAQPTRLTRGRWRKHGIARTVPRKSKIRKHLCDSRDSCDFSASASSKVAGVATVATVHLGNQNYGNGEQAPPAPAASIEERRASV